MTMLVPANQNEIAAPTGGPDPVAMLLADKRSAATRRAYQADLKDFFGEGADQARVGAFLGLTTPQVALRLTQYKADMLVRGLSEATINRRLSAVRALLKFSHRLGLTQTDGSNLVDSEKVVTYRDTKGVDTKGIKRLIALPASLHGAETLRGRRDTALLNLLCENALRRAEVCALNVGDFGLTEKRLYILGKGKGSQKAPITLSPRIAGHIAAYLITAGHAADEAGPLFRNLSHRPDHSGGRLTSDGLYHLVAEYGKAMGVTLTPHKLRHSSITAFLDATGGDVRAAQKLSRHAKVDTVMKYDDNRKDIQGKASVLLSDLFNTR